MGWVYQAGIRRLAAVRQSSTTSTSGGIVPLATIWRSVCTIAASSIRIISRARG
jgi:hypothetical protein